MQAEYGDWPLELECTNQFLYAANISLEICSRICTKISNVEFISIWFEIRKQPEAN